MLIEVDAQLFLDKEATGIAIYAGNMIRELWKCGHQIQYDIFEAKKIEQEVTNLKNSEHIEYSEMKKIFEFAISIVIVYINGYLCFFHCVTAGCLVKMQMLPFF